MGGWEGQEHGDGGAQQRRRRATDERSEITRRPRDRLVQVRGGTTGRGGHPTTRGAGQTQPGSPSHRTNVMNGGLFHLSSISLLSSVPLRYNSQSG